MRSQLQLHSTCLGILKVSARSSGAGSARRRTPDSLLERVTHQARADIAPVYNRCARTRPWARIPRLTALSDAFAIVNTGAFSRQRCCAMTHSRASLPVARAAMMRNSKPSSITPVFPTSTAKHRGYKNGMDDQRFMVVKTLDVWRCEFEVTHGPVAYVCAGGRHDESESARGRRARRRHAGRPALAAAVSATLARSNVRHQLDLLEHRRHNGKNDHPYACVATHRMDK